MTGGTNVQPALLYPTTRSGRCRGVCPLVAAMAVLMHAAPAVAEDVVVLRAREGRTVARSTGEIVEYTGQQLLLRHPGGREESIDLARVIEVQADRKSHQLSADGLFEEGNFGEALAGYRKALAEESRPWLKRQIVAQAVWCLRYLGQTDQAIDPFLALYRQDPTTPFLDAAPLSWTTTEPPAAILQRCTELLDARESPVGRLIAASWLLPTAQRAKALNVLRDLNNASDARVALLAEAQLWRTQIVTVKPEDVARWQSRLDRMPSAIQAGPTCLVGLALARLNQPAEAALQFLRVPILHPRHRELASQALLEAGRQMEKMDDQDSAVRLYREIVDRYPGSEPAAEAIRRLEKNRSNG